jgi:hypothetical protein
MLRPIQFRDQPPRKTNEVDDVWAKCRLSPKLVAANLAGAQV